MAGLRLCLAGAPLDTGNRGVEALSRSVLAATAREAPGSAVTVLDNGWGVRANSTFADLRVELSGVRRTRRVYRRESWINVRLSQRVRGAGNPVARSLRQCDAVLDISGGDSFTDIYGRGRLQTVLSPKLATLRGRRPLVLLPQTYGPFTERTSWLAAADVVRRAELAIARDEESYAVLVDLAGRNFDPARHRRGVDVAFGLAPRRPRRGKHEALARSLERQRTRPHAGVNISGLLWRDDAAPKSLQLRLDYARVCRDLVEGLVAAGADVLLISHVRDVAHRRESDLAAAEALLASLPTSTAASVRIAPDDLDADEVKWVIAQLDWFSGARMHATIAAMSSGVPASAIGYSMKTRAVFATCGVADEVVDAGTTDTADAVQRLLNAFTRRGEVQATLTRTVPEVVEQATRQLADVLGHVATTARRPRVSVP
jgi:colanic acid/amylovoran biosynthesis protein